MSDNFTICFVDDPDAFSLLHELLEGKGYVTQSEGPNLNRPAHNSLNRERYQQLFDKHYPSQYMQIEPSVCVFDIGDGFPSFYVVYDQQRFEDSNAVRRALQRIGILN